MPYAPKLRHLFKILFRVRDKNAAEGLFFEGTYLAERGEEDAAREAFRHAMRLDPDFGGAAWNYAALTEKKLGACAETVAAWREFIAAAQRDGRQREATVLKVAAHLAALEAQLKRN